MGSEAAALLGRMRMEGMTAKERLRHQRAAADARWERWRAANPAKAAASEGRRRKRAASAPRET
jgi:hypothetical protein